MSHSLDSDGGLRTKLSLAKVQYSTKLSSQWLALRLCFFAIDFFFNVQMSYGSVIYISKYEKLNICLYCSGLACSKRERQILGIILCVHA